MFVSRREVVGRTVGELDLPHRHGANRHPGSPRRRGHAGPRRDIFLVGMCITTLTSLAMLTMGHRILKVPMGYLIGVLAGLQTQPAVLAYATEQAGEELPNLGYAAVRGAGDPAHLAVPGRWGQNLHVSRAASGQHFSMVGPCGSSPPTSPPSLPR